MNKRQAKKKHIYESECEKIWGYVMSYSELRNMKREYHETVIVQHNYRNITDYSDLEELSIILGIHCDIKQNNYRYPNRLRFHTIKKLEGEERVLK